MLSSRARWAGGATKRAVCPRRSLRSLRALGARVPWRSPTTRPAGRTIVAILPSLAHKTGRSVGTGVALGTHRAWLTSRSKLAVMTGSPWRTGDACSNATSRENQKTITERIFTWLAWKTCAATGTTLSLNTGRAGNATAAVRPR